MLVSFCDCVDLQQLHYSLQLTGLARVDVKQQSMHVWQSCANTAGEGGAQRRHGVPSSQRMDKMACMA